jgi:hypothetical protein
VVTIQFPSLAIATTLGVAPNYDPNTCAISMNSNPIFFAVTDRGNAVFRLNTYGVPSYTAITNASGASWFQAGSVTAPVAFNNYATGYNTEASFNVQSGGANELPGLPGIIGSLIYKQVPATVANPNPIPSVTPVATGGYPGNTYNAATNLQNPGMSARDAYGNVYVVVQQVDPTPTNLPGATATPTSSIIVICGSTLGPSGIPCVKNSAIPGTVLQVDNGFFQPTYVRGKQTNANANYVPQGIAADALGNLFITMAKPAPSSTPTGTVFSECFTAGGPGCGAGNGITTGPGITGLNGVGGLDLKSNGNKVNLLVAETYGAAFTYPNGLTLQGRIRATCGFIDTIGPCKAGASTSIPIPYPIDVKMNWNGNLVVSSASNVIYGYCLVGGAGDFCDGQTSLPATIVIAGQYGTPGDTGDGSTIVVGSQTAWTTNVLVTQPSQVVIGKAFNDDYGNPLFATFRDNNIIFTERYYSGGTVSAASGSTVRIICGNNALLSSGLCNGVGSGVIFKLAGNAGQLGNANTGAGSFSTQSTIVDPIGASYDGYKNLFFSSGQIALDDEGNATSAIPNPEPSPAAVVYADRSVRTINFAAPSPVLGLRYTFTDSNQLSAIYCMQFQVLTNCQAGNCVCQLIAPAGNGTSLFNSISSTAACPTLGGSGASNPVSE